jgi:CubicO group peptidase (beta-lactamase class C family)
MKTWLRSLALVLVLFAPAIGAQRLPTASPESVGVSTERLDRLHRGMQALIDQHQVGGIVTLLMRDGKLLDLKAYGAQDNAGKTMQTDTLFRIASMTKPITSVAIMMLYEDGKLQLTDPLSKFIPAFREMKVLSPGTNGASPGLVPARRQITIRDLLTHRSGLTYGFIDAATVGEAYRKGSVSDGLTFTEGTIGDNIERLAKAPLVSQPGAEWHYSLSTDVLGRVVEVASGQTFDAFLRERIFTPLKMVDTSFEVPEAKWPRLATVFTPEGGNGIRPMKDPESFGNTFMSPFSYYKAGKKYFSGGAGLVSTAQDYARFAQMLLNKGELDGVRILSPKTVELMTTSHTNDLPPGTAGGPGSNWGLGFQIRTDLGATQQLGSQGMYGWSGIYGTYFWVDPKERLVAIMMVQRYPGTPVAAPFQSLTYQALIK